MFYIEVNPGKWSNDSRTGAHDTVDRAFLANTGEGNTWQVKTVECCLRISPARRAAGAI